MGRSFMFNLRVQNPLFLEENNYPLSIPDSIYSRIAIYPWNIPPTTVPGMLQQQELNIQHIVPECSKTTQRTNTKHDKKTWIRRRREACYTEYIVCVNELCFHLHFRPWYCWVDNFYMSLVFATNGVSPMDSKGCVHLYDKALASENLQLQKGKLPPTLWKACWACLGASHLRKGQYMKHFLTERNTRAVVESWSASHLFHRWCCQASESILLRVHSLQKTNSSNEAHQSETRLIKWLRDTEYLWCSVALLQGVYAICNSSANAALTISPESWSRSKEAKESRSNLKVVLSTLPNCSYFDWLASCKRLSSAHAHHI